MQNPFRTDQRKKADFLAAVLMLIRREHVADDSQFAAIIANGKVVGELLDNYDYYHMYGYDVVIEDLAAKELLIAV